MKVLCTTWFAVRVVIKTSCCCYFIDYGTLKKCMKPLTESEALLRPRPHVSGYFWIRNFFLSGYGYRPHACGEFAGKSGNFWIRSPEWKFLNPITFRIRVDGRIRIFFDTMTSQNWRQYLPRKFKLGRRSKVNSFCAPCAYFQSFSLYAAKMSLY